MSELFMKNTNGSYDKVSSDLRFTTHIPYHSQVEEYIKRKEREREIEQFRLQESPLYKKKEVQNEDTNGVDDSLEYRSFMPSQDFIFSHSKKSTEVKDFAKYSQDNQNSSIFKNIKELNIGDLKGGNQVQVNEFQTISNSNNDKINYHKQGLSNNVTVTGKVWDNFSGSDSKTQNNINTVKDSSLLNQKPTINESNLDPTSQIAGVDYYFKNGIIKNENIDDYSLKKNNPTFLTCTPTKDSSRFQRSSSDYQRSQNNHFDDEYKDLKNRSVSHSKYNFSGINNPYLQLSKTKDFLTSNRPSEPSYSYQAPQQASFRNPADFYSVQIPESEFPYYEATNLTYSASNQKKKPYTNYNNFKHDELFSNPSNVDTFSYQKNSDLWKKKVQDQPFFSHDLRNDNNKINDINQDSQNLLSQMKERQQSHERKLQDILRDSYEKHHKQAEDYYQKKQQKDLEIQNQYLQLQKFQQQTSHFNQNSHYDPIPDISEIKDLNHSNTSEFMNRESYDPYTPNSSAFKSQLKHGTKQHISEHPSFLKNSARKDSQNNIYDNGKGIQQSGQKQYHSKEQNSYILEIDDSFQKKNNKNQSNNNNGIHEKQQKEIESLRKKIREDESERINQKKLYQEQQKRIENLEKEIQQLTSRLRDVQNSNSKNNSNQSRKENLSQSSGPSTFQNKRSSKSESKNDNNNLKIINNYEIDQLPPHNCGSGMAFNQEQKFRFKITELLQAENDEEIIQKIKNLVQYKKQNEGFTRCVTETLEQLAPPGHFKNKKPSLAESWKFMKNIMQQYVNLAQEKKRLKQLAKQLSEVIANGIDSENQDLQNSIRNILII